MWCVCFLKKIFLDSLLVSEDIYYCLLKADLGQLSGSVKKKEGISVASREHLRVWGGYISHLILLSSQGDAGCWKSGLGCEISSLACVGDFEQAKAVQVIFDSRLILADCCKFRECQLASPRESGRSAVIHLLFKMTIEFFLLLLTFEQNCSWKQVLWS